MQVLIKSKFFEREFNKMKVFIITEGGKNIGFGHITRCLSLYQAFEERGIKPKFIVNGDNDIEYLLNGANYQLLNWIEKPEKLFKLIKGSDIAIIDSYLADISLYNTLSDLVKLPVYIDGNKRLEYPKGIVLNGNIYAERLNYPKKDGVKYLLGIKYTPLRKEFWGLSEKKINEKIKSVMVVFGGSDTKNLTPKILSFLKNVYPNLIKNVIIGNTFHNIEEIKKYDDKNTNLIYYPDAEKIREIMLESDIAVSAGGQTLYEFARVGVPTIGICVADNQRLNIQEWERVGFISYIGYCSNENILTNLKNAIEKNIDYNLRKRVSILGRKIIDGKGSLNLVDKVISSFFRISNTKLEK